MAGADAAPDHLSIGVEQPWLAFLAFRVLHAFGMDRPAPNPFRIAGQVGTWTLLGGLALYAIWVASAG